MALPRYQCFGYKVDGAAGGYLDYIGESDVLTAAFKITLDFEGTECGRDCHIFDTVNKRIIRWEEICDETGRIING